MKWLFFILMISLLSCGIQAPQLSVTGEKTALEKQVLGDYEKVEADSWSIASDRSFNRFSTAPRNRLVFQAIQRSKARKLDLEPYKKEKVIGENNRGFLEILPTEQYEEKQAYRLGVNQLVHAENDDRKIVYERLIAINQWQADESTYFNQFARPLQNEAAAGTMIQTQAGTWVEKKQQENQNE